MKIMLVIVFLLNFVLSGSMKYMTMLVRFLQIVLHLPLIHISIPGNVISLNKVLIEVAMFDILDSSYTTDLLLRYKEDKADEFDEGTLDQAQDVGYESHYTI